MDASLPGVKFGRLHYRQLESEKNLALKKNKGNFDTTLFLTTTAKNEWWLENIAQSCYWIHPPVIHTHMYCDASDHSLQRKKTHQAGGITLLPTQKTEENVSQKTTLMLYFSYRQNVLK